MYYNYIRFGSVLEFGQGYQLTFTNNQYSAKTVFALPVMLWLGVFQPFQFKAVFPFVFGGDHSRAFAGWFYDAGVIPVCSLIPLAYIVFIPSIWSRWKKRHGTFSFCVLLFVFMIAVFLCFFEFLTTGIHLRYTAEPTALLIPVIGVLVGNCICSMDTEVQRKKALGIVMVLAVYTLAVGFLFGIVGENNWIYTNHPEFYYNVQRAFCFWM